MGRGGLVYVKRDMSNEEAPSTFSSETENPLLDWVDWAGRYLGAPESIDALPANAPNCNAKQVAAARALFLGIVDAAGEKAISDWDLVVGKLLPALGSPWHGVDGSRYPQAQESWLLSGMGRAHPKGSGWVEWATASLKLLRNDRDAANTVLPCNTVIDPWQEDLRGRWAYRVLDQWLSSSDDVRPRWTGLVHMIDALVEAQDSRLGLPSHWRIAARQAEASLVNEEGPRLSDIGDLPPIHGAMKLASRTAPLVAWAGVAEWAISRFSRNTKRMRNWDQRSWERVSRLAKEDLLRRDPGSHKLMLPIVEDLKASARIAVGPGAEAPLLAEIEAWLLNIGAPEVSRKARPHRL